MFPHIITLSTAVLISEMVGTAKHIVLTMNWIYNNQYLCKKWPQRTALWATRRNLLRLFCIGSFAARMLKLWKLILFALGNIFILTGIKNWMSAIFNKTDLQYLRKIWGTRSPTTAHYCSRWNRIWWANLDLTWN